MLCCLSKYYFFFVSHCSLFHPWGAASPTLPPPKTGLYGAKTHSIMTFSIITLSIFEKSDIHHNDTHHNAEHYYTLCPVMLSGIYAECHLQALYAECRYAECRYGECLCPGYIKWLCRYHCNIQSNFYSIETWGQYYKANTTVIHWHFRLNYVVIFIKFNLPWNYSTLRWYNSILHQYFNPRKGRVKITMVIHPGIFITLAPGVKE